MNTCSYDKIVTSVCQEKREEFKGVDREVGGGVDYSLLFISRGDLL